MEAIRFLVRERTIAAFIMEPVLGAGGVIVPHASFMPGVREICDRHGILLIADEVITGFGRTGRWFACETFGIQPDMMTLAKAMAGGVPMGATLVSAAIEAGVGHHGSTFGGNPLACTAAIAAIKYTLENDIPGQMAEKGHHHFGVVGWRFNLGLDTIERNEQAQGTHGIRWPRRDRS